MGLIKSGLFIIVAVLFLISLIIGNLFLTFSFSLEYNTLQNSISSVAENLITKNNLQNEEYFNNFKEYCKEHSEFSYDVNGKEMNIPCKTILEGKTNTSNYINENSEIDSLNNYEYLEGYCKKDQSFVFEHENSGLVFNLSCNKALDNSSAFLNEIIKDTMKDIYYRNYNCEFAAFNLFYDCVKKYNPPFFLVSEQMKDYWYGKFYTMLFISLVLFALMFLFAEKKSNWLIISGIIIFVSSLPFFKPELFLFFSASEYAEFVQAFLIRAKSVAFIFLISGLIIFLLGIGFRVWGFGNFIADKFGRFNSKSE